MSACPHRTVIAWTTEDGNPAGLWSCIDCRAKFVPLGPEMEAQKRALDAAVAQARREEKERCAAVCDGALHTSSHDDPDVAWYAGAGWCAAAIRALGTDPEAK